MKRRYKHQQKQKTFKTVYKEMVRKNGDFLNDFLDDTKFIKTKATLIFLMLIMGSALESVIK